MRKGYQKSNGMIMVLVVAVVMVLSCSVAYHRPGEGIVRGAIGNLHQDDVFIRRILENQHSSVDQPPIHSIREVSLRRLQQSANSEALEEDIFAASRNGKDATVRKLVEVDHVDPNVVSADGLTPLVYAANSGHTETVKTLIQLGANVDKKAAEEGVTALWVAAQQGHQEICEVLLLEDADVNHISSDGTTPLYVAALQNHPDVVNLLLTKGADINARASSGASPLMAAVHQDNLDIVNILLQGGADPNLNKTLSGQTMLWTAAYRKNDKIIMELIDNGARLNMPAVDGTTPLLISIIQECTECAEVLLKKGADPNLQRGTDMWTPLHMAAANVYIVGVELLLKFNANKGMLDSIKRRPVDVIGRLETPSPEEKATLTELLNGEPIVTLSAVAGGVTKENEETEASEESKESKKTSGSELTGKSSVGSLAVAALIILAILVAFQAMYIFVQRRKRHRNYPPTEDSAPSPVQRLQERLSTQSYVPTSPVTVVSPRGHHNGSSSSMDNPFSPTQNVPPAPDSPETHRPAGRPVLESLPSDYEDSRGKSIRGVPVDYNVVHQLYSTRENDYDGFGNFRSGGPGAVC